MTGSDVLLEVTQCTICNPNPSTKLFLGLGSIFPPIPLKLIESLIFWLNLSDLILKLNISSDHFVVSWSGQFQVYIPYEIKVLG